MILCPLTNAGKTMYSISSWSANPLKTRFTLSPLECLRTSDTLPSCTFREEDLILASPVSVFHDSACMGLKSSPVMLQIVVVAVASGLIKIAIKNRNLTFTPFLGQKFLLARNPVESHRDCRVTSNRLYTLEPFSLSRRPVFTIRHRRTIRLRRW